MCHILAGLIIYSKDTWDTHTVSDNGDPVTSHMGARTDGTISVLRLHVALTVIGLHLHFSFRFH